MRVLGVDPGQTTGLCIIDGKQWDGTEAKSLSELAFWIVAQLPVDVIVMENFFIGRHTRNAPAPLHAIGVVTLLTEVYDVPLVVQSPSVLQSRVARRVFDSGRSRSPHIRSALSHAKFYLKKRGLDDGSDD